MTMTRTKEGATGIRDESATEELDEIECTAILARHSTAHLALFGGDQLELFPVQYAVDGKWLVFRLPPVLDHDRANFGQLVLEVDEADGDGERFVVVHGSASEITDGLDEASVRERRIAPGPPTDEHTTRWLRIVPRDVTGRTRN